MLLALVLVVCRNPDRRYRLIHLFRRGDASVHYSRVSIRQNSDRVPTQCSSHKIDQNEFRQQMQSKAYNKTEQNQNA